MTTHSGILAWEVPWTEKPGRLQSIGSQKSQHDLATQQQQPAYLRIWRQRPLVLSKWDVSHCYIHLHFFEVKPFHSCIDSRCFSMNYLLTFLIKHSELFQNILSWERLNLSLILWPTSNFLVQPKDIFLSANLLLKNIMHTLQHSTWQLCVHLKNMYFLLCGWFNHFIQTRI